MHDAGIANIDVHNLRPADLQALPADVTNEIQTLFPEIFKDIKQKQSTAAEEITVNIPSLNFGGQTLTNITKITYSPPDLIFTLANGSVGVSILKLTPEDYAKAPPEIQKLLADIPFLHPKPPTEFFSKDLSYSGDISGLADYLKSEAGIYLSYDPLVQSAIKRVPSPISFQAAKGSSIETSLNTFIQQSQKLRVIPISSKVYFLTSDQGEAIEKGLLALNYGDYAECASLEPSLKESSLDFAQYLVKAIDAQTQFVQDMNPLLGEINRQVGIIQGLDRNIQQRESSSRLAESESQQIITSGSTISSQAGQQAEQAAATAKKDGLHSFALSQMDEAKKLTIQKNQALTLLGQKLAQINQLLSLHLNRYQENVQVFGAESPADVAHSMMINLSTQIKNLRQTYEGVATRLASSNSTLNTSSLNPKVFSDFEKLLNELSTHRSHQSSQHNTHLFEMLSRFPALTRSDLTIIFAANDFYVGNPWRWDNRVLFGLSQLVAKDLQKEEFHHLRESIDSHTAENLIPAALSPSIASLDANKAPDKSGIFTQYKPGMVTALAIQINEDGTHKGITTSRSASVFAQAPSGVPLSSQFAKTLGNNTAMPSNIYTSAIMPREDIDSRVSIRDAALWALAQPQLSAFRSHNLVLNYDETMNVNIGGPSAGAAWGTCIYSALSGRPCNTQVAMTGTISPAGKIGAVGGVPAKISGAIGAGCLAVFIPEENASDINFLTATDLLRIQVISVKEMSDLIPLVLEKGDTESHNLLAGTTLYFSALNFLQKSQFGYAKWCFSKVLEYLPHHLSAQKALESLSSETPQQVPILMQFLQSLEAKPGADKSESDYLLSQVDDALWHMKIEKASSLFASASNIWPENPNLSGVKNKIDLFKGVRIALLIGAAVMAYALVSQLMHVISSRIIFNRRKRRR